MSRAPSRADLIATVGAVVVFIASFLPWLDYGGFGFGGASASVWHRELLPQVFLIVFAAIGAATLGWVLPAGRHGSATWLGITVNGWRAVLSLVALVSSVLFLIAYTGAASWGEVVALIGCAALGFAAVGACTNALAPWLGEVAFPAPAQHGAHGQYGQHPGWQGYGPPATPAPPGWSAAPATPAPGQGFAYPAANAGYQPSAEPAPQPGYRAQQPAHAPLQDTAHLWAAAPVQPAEQSPVGQPAAGPGWFPQPAPVTQQLPVRHRIAEEVPAPAPGFVPPADPAGPAAESRPHVETTTPAAGFAPYWAAVENPVAVFSQSEPGAHLTVLQPGEWYLVQAEQSDGLVVQTPSGAAVLRDSAGLIRAE